MFAFKCILCQRNVRQQQQHRSTSYLQQCNEEKEGIGCPPELRVEEPGKEGEDIIFGCAEDRIKGGKRMEEEARQKQCD